MSTETPNPDHDRLCEDASRSGRGLPCRCADRRAGTEIDPRLLASRARRLRQAKEALATVRRTLVSYVREFTPASCEHNSGIGARPRCPAPVDGVLLVSCGHVAYLCGAHLTKAVQDARGADSMTCTRGLPDIHAHPVHNVTTEWEIFA